MQKNNSPKLYKGQATLDGKEGSELMEFGYCFFLRSWEESVKAWLLARGKVSAHSTPWSGCISTMIGNSTQSGKVVLWAPALKHQLPQSPKFICYEEWYVPLILKTEWLLIFRRKSEGEERASLWATHTFWCDRTLAEQGLGAQAYPTG